MKHRIKPRKHKAGLRKSRGSVHEAAPASTALIVVPEPVASLARPVVDAGAIYAHFLRGRNKNTHDAYVRDLASFGEFCGAHAEQAVQDFLMLPSGPAHAKALDWLATMQEKGEASATRARRLSALRAVSRLGRMLGVTSWALEVQGPKVQRYKDTKGPALEAVRRLLAVCEDDLEGRRDRLILRLLYSLGLRRFEVCKALVEDEQDGVLHVVGKGGLDVRRTLPAKLKVDLAAWYERRAPQLGELQPKAPLICTLRPGAKGAALTLRGMNRVLEHLGKRAGFHVWPHALRHSSVTRSLTNFDVRDVQKHSRHVDLNTVVHYDDNVSDVAGEIAEFLDGEL